MSYMTNIFKYIFGTIFIALLPVLLAVAGLFAGVVSWVAMFQLWLFFTDGEGKV